MAHYRHSFPESTVLPKMHILEDHVIPWLQKWQVGSGIMGEQGAESIHSHLRKLEEQYNGIVNPLQRLSYVIKEHNLEAAPQLNSLKPEPKRYKKN